MIHSAFGNSKLQYANIIIICIACPCPHVSSDKSILILLFSFRFKIVINSIFFTLFSSSTSNLLLTALFSVWHASGEPEHISSSILEPPLWRLNHVFPSENQEVLERSFRSNLGPSSRSKGTTEICREWNESPWTLDLERRALPRSIRQTNNSWEWNPMANIRLGPSPKRFGTIQQWPNVKK